jgi:hypothetical protein
VRKRARLALAKQALAKQALAKQALAAEPGYSINNLPEYARDTCAFDSISCSTDHNLCRPEAIRLAGAELDHLTSHKHYITRAEGCSKRCGCGENQDRFRSLFIIIHFCIRRLQCGGQVLGRGNLVCTCSHILYGLR